MPGSMRQRGEDSWQLRVHAGRDSITGRKRYVERTFRGTKRQASKALAALVTETEGLAPRSTKEGTVGALLNEWLEHAAPSFSPKTVATCRGYIDSPIIPAIGSISASKLTANELDRFYRHLLEVGTSNGPYAPATIRRVHGIIRRAMTQGVRWGWISRNPAIDASPPRVPLHDIQPPSPNEVVKLFRLAQESDPDLATFIVLAASSGARRGELIALRWSDIDLDRGTLSIERGIVLVNGELIEQGTKTHQSRRITLDAATVKTLTEHHDRMSEAAALAGTTLSPDAFVFSETIDGSLPWRPDSTSRAFRSLCKKAGVKGVRLHDLRHYVATRLLTAGVDVRTVAGRLGHRNPSTTLNVYAHFVPESDHEAADVLGQIFGDAERAIGDPASSEAKRVPKGPVRQRGRRPRPPARDGGAAAGDGGAA
jgi:integrase